MATDANCNKRTVSSSDTMYSVVLFKALRGQSGSQKKKKKKKKKIFFLKIQFSESITLFYFLAKLPALQMCIKH